MLFVFLGGHAGSKHSFIAALHMHQTGVRATNEVIRDGEVIHKGAVDFFDFDQQGSFQVQQSEFKVQPGDSFRTTCYYRDGTEFGSSSQEEMCIAFLLYYPVQQFSGFPWFCAFDTGLNICEEELSVKNFLDLDELERVFGSASTPIPTQSPTKFVDSPSDAPSAEDDLTSNSSSSSLVLPFLFLIGIICFMEFAN